MNISCTWTEEWAVRNSCTRASLRGVQGTRFRCTLSLRKQFVVLDRKDTTALGLVPRAAQRAQRTRRSESHVFSERSHPEVRFSFSARELVTEITHPLSLSVFRHRNCVNLSETARQGSPVFKHERCANDRYVLPDLLFFSSRVG